jgi:WD40 repeat protein
MNRVESRGQALCATGGREHLLKLWDLETGTHVFKEKNVPHDFLDVRVPVWISDIQFSPSDPHLVYTSTSHGQVSTFTCDDSLSVTWSLCYRDLWSVCCHSFVSMIHVQV